MEECSLDLIFLLGTARPFFSGGGEAVFFQYMKLDFLRQSESIYICNHRRCFYNCFIIAIRPLGKFNFSFNKKEYI